MYTKFNFKKSDLYLPSLARHGFSRKNPRCQWGFGLIELLVSVGLLAVIGMGVSKMMGLSFKAQGSLELRSDREAIKRMLLSVVDCNASVTTSTCTNTGDIVSLSRVNSNAPYITASGGLKMGRWTVRAECGGPGEGVVLRVARPKPGTGINSTNMDDFFPDPSTGAAYTWADDQSLLFPEGVEICTPTENAPPSGGTPPSSGSATYTRYCSYQNAIDFGFCDVLVPYHSSGVFVPNPHASCAVGWVTCGATPSQQGGSLGWRMTISSGCIITCFD